MDVETRWHVTEPDGFVHHAAYVSGSLIGFESGKAAARYITLYNASAHRQIPAAAIVEECTCGN